VTPATPQACLTAFIDAMVGRDMAAALALMTDDVVFFYSNGSALWGKAAFASVMTANWKLVESYSYSTLDSVWLSQGDDAAAVAYAFAWSGIAGGRDVSGGGRGTRVFRREPDGWRLAHEHLSVGDWKPA
jgi:ketosteroid isomerase-like protein